MENQVKRKRGGQIKYHTEEERKAAIRSQTKYMLNKEWYCDICRNDFNYWMSGKWKHISSKRNHKLQKEQLDK